MDRYSRAKIYRLVGGGKTYYGSTCLALSRRMAQHRKDYKQWLSGKQRFVSSFHILPETDCQIVLVEEFPCENKEQLGARERYWIENNECVNMIVPTRTRKEHYEDTKDTIKKYYQSNKAKKQEQYKAYYEANKDKISERRRLARANKRSLLSH